MLCVHYPCVDSTNSRAAGLARLNPRRPLLVSARTQSAGRGRQGRCWQSPPGGAWFSIAWPMHRDHPDRRVVPVVVGLAVAEALEAVLAEHGRAQLLELKWPNDVLLNGEKICGILCEQTLSSHAGPPHAAPRAPLIIGIGINVNLNPDDLSELRMAATSLQKVLGGRVPITHVIALVARCLRDRLRELEAYGLHETMQDALTLRLAWMNQPVVVQCPHDRLEGVVRGISHQGELILETRGQQIKLSMGEVEKIRAIDTAPGQVARAVTGSRVVLDAL